MSLYDDEREELVGGGAKAAERPGPPRWFYAGVLLLGALVLFCSQPAVSRPKLELALQRCNRVTARVFHWLEMLVGEPAVFKIRRPSRQKQTSVLQAARPV